MTQEKTETMNGYGAAEELQYEGNPTKVKESSDDYFVSLKHIDKIYDNNVQAVFDFNLDIKKHEFIVFVGPSGCGKSTTLRMIAGLEDITKGELYIDNELCNDKTPKDRDIAMVFQSYALYPHMSVYENMAFGLKIRRMPKYEIDKRVHEAARILQIEEYLDRKPKALSGGQRQRVALGRAIVRNAKVFLMDEPLSNLDAKLRVQMRSEIIKLHEALGATTIYVTHDQIEAMTMADRIVVMNKGYIQQIGTPKELYYEPKNMFVAGFIGDPQMNFIYGKIEDNNFIAKDGAVIDLTGYNAEKLEKARKLEEIVIGFRPECCEVWQAKKPNSFVHKMNVEVSELLGDTMNIYGYLNKTNMVIKTSPFTKYTVNEDLDFCVEYKNVILFDAKTEEII